MVAAGVSIGQSLVGRDEELTKIEAALGEDGHGALVEGDPGIGKTALWRAGVEKARDRGALVLQSQPGEAERRLSFAALDDLFSDELAEALPHISSPRRRALEVALLRADDPDASPDPRGVATAVLEVIRWLGRDRAVVVAIDDAQWLDPESARALTFALRRLEPNDVTVLATRRTGTDRAPVHLLRALDERAITRLTLRPLEIEAIRLIIRRQLGVRLSRPARRRVYELSGGNPLFALELARSRGSEPLWSEGAELPDRLAWAIRRRIGALPPPVGQVLCAAALTQQPTVSVLASVTGRSVTEMRDAAAVAERAGVAVISPDSKRQAEDAVRFRHPLFRSVATELLPPARVRAFHQAYARVVVDPEGLGRHLAASAQGPDEDVAAALDRASRHARSRGALDAAAELSDLMASEQPAGETALRATGG